MRAPLRILRTGLALGLGTWLAVAAQFALAAAPDCVGGAPHCPTAQLVPDMPGPGTIVVNPYGPMTIIGGSLNGNAITFFSPNAVIQIGTTPGNLDSFAVIDFQGLDVGAGNSLTVRSGAPGQTLVLNNVGANASVIAGLVIAIGNNGALPPTLELSNAQGVGITVVGRVIAPLGLTVDALGADWTTGGGIVNQGLLDGGPNLQLRGGAINGGGDFLGNVIGIATFGNANNPVHGAHFLSNGLLMKPSSGTDVALTLNHYGSVPQVINLAIDGNVNVLMPSSWPSGSSAPPNNAPVLPADFRPAGQPDPPYGGAGLILQVTGSLGLGGGLPNDFVYPGSIVLKAADTINFNGVRVDNAWTTSGTSFQGLFFEAPNIVSTTGNIQVRTNDLNWANFSSFPKAPVRAWTLVRMGDGSARFAPADAVVPHVNTYSLLIEAAAAGECWVCQMNLNPVSMY